MKEPISDDEHVLRRVPFVWIREDGSISDNAYKPVFPRDDDGVSIGIKRKINTKSKIRSFNRGRQKSPRATSVCQILTIIPRNFDYDIVHKPYEDKDHLGLIIGDMNKLLDDIEALTAFADNSEIIFNHPYKDWI